MSEVVGTVLPAIKVKELHNESINFAEKKIMQLSRGASQIQTQTQDRNSIPHPECRKQI